MITFLLSDSAAGFESPPCFSKRERRLLGAIIELCQEKLNVCLNPHPDDSLMTFVPHLPMNGTQHRVGDVTEVLLTIFHSSCRVFISNNLALELVNRYLKRTSPVVERKLNQEELSVVALVTTLVISELRDLGYSGVYLRTVNQIQLTESIVNQALILEETNSRQWLIIEPEALLNEQIRERSRLTIGSEPVENLVLKTVYTAELKISAEVRSLSMLLKLIPGVSWKLGSEVAPAIGLAGRIIGYGELIIKDDKNHETT